MLASARASILGIPIPDDPPVTIAIGRTFLSSSSHLMLTYDANLLDFFRVSTTSSAVDFLPRRAGVATPNDCERPMSSKNLANIVPRWVVFMAPVLMISRVDSSTVRSWNKV